MNLLQRKPVKVENEKGYITYELLFNTKILGDDEPAYVYKFIQDTYDESARMIDEKVRLIQIDDLEELDFVYKHIEEYWDYVNSLYNYKTPYIVLVQIRPNDNYMSFKRVAIAEDIVGDKVSNCEKCVITHEYTPLLREGRCGRTEVQFTCLHNELFNNYNDGVL